VVVEVVVLGTELGTGVVVVATVVVVGSVDVEIVPPSGVERAVVVAAGPASPRLPTAPAGAAFAASAGLAMLPGIKRAMRQAAAEVAARANAALFPGKALSLLAGAGEKRQAKAPLTLRQQQGGALLPDG
jgi:hypothetical protein